MMLGSLMAGIGFANSDTAAVHSMAEAMGGALDIPHGVANAVCLPWVTAHNLPAAEAKTAHIGKAMGLASEGLSQGEAAQQTVSALFALVHRLGIPTMRMVGIAEEHVPELVALAMMNSGTPDNPVEMDDESFRKLFLEGLKGQ
jgi:alcohol dehydrogenase